jgi:hypothetical protein
MEEIEAIKQNIQGAVTALNTCREKSIGRDFASASETNSLERAK